MRAYGAQVELVPGTRQATSDEAERQASQIFYASHNWQPFFLQGTKTLAYELWEDLGFRAPDHVIIPCGAGSNVLGCHIGFSELQRAGAIDRLPRLWAAQPENCGPIAADALGIPRPEIQPTIAEGTAIAAPVRLPEVLAALADTGGGGVLLSEPEIEIAVIELARTGIYVEPTCAQASAAFAKLLASGEIKPGETVVLVLTGTGLKATPRIAEILGVPAS
jgi:threonine synthase